MGAKLIITTRTDGRYGWRLIGDNGSDTIATDGGQGYVNRSKAEEMATKVISGHYGQAEVLYEVPRP